MEVFLGQICAFGFNYAPVYFATCEGQILPIRQYTALFALLGVYYGGDGTSTFALPNLVGRVAIGYGDGPGLPIYNIGENGGSLTATMSTANMAVHTHASVLTLQIDSSGNPGNTNSPQNASLSSGDIECYNGTPGTNQYLRICPNNQAFTDASGVAAPASFSVQSPALAMNYCIAMEGTFPVRS